MLKKYPENNLPDDKLALCDFESELTLLASFLHEQIIAHSLARALDEDAEARRSVKTEEFQDESDQARVEI